MKNNIKLYEGAKTINTEIDDNVTIGQDSFIINSKIGQHVQINRRNIIDNTTIGRYSYTGANSILKSTVIGSFCSISWNVSITGNKHEYKQLSTHPFWQLPSFGIVDENVPHKIDIIHLGNDVWVAANACIMPGVTIGDGAVIGAGSVVTKDVPPYAVMVGNPAQVLKKRFCDDWIERLLRIKWWDFPEKELKNNIMIFAGKVTEKTINSLEKISQKIGGEDA